jgi:hypothetical protein
MTAGYPAVPRIGMVPAGDRRVSPILNRRTLGMTSQSENELLTRIGSGTPMGVLMR